MHLAGHTPLTPLTSGHPPLSSLKGNTVSLFGSLLACFPRPFLPEFASKTVPIAGINPFSLDFGFFMMVERQGKKMHKCIDRLQGGQSLSPHDADRSREEAG